MLVWLHAGTYALYAIIGLLELAQAHSAYVNGYCTRENLSLFHSYFPYIVATGPATLILVQKFFAK